MSDKNTLGPNGYLPPTNAANVGRKRQYRTHCGKCGAQRIDAQIGLEPSPAAYVAALVAVFREVRRVLRTDGTCWLNLGDSYMSNGQSQNAPGGIVGQPGMRQGNATRPPKATAARYRLRADLTTEQTAYVLSELAKASLMESATVDGDE
jgi:hypothetical protein